MSKEAVEVAPNSKEELQKQYTTRSSVEKWDKKQKGLDEKLDSREASVILVKYDKKNE